MCSEKCQEIENHLKFLLSMDSKNADPTLTRDASLRENSHYQHESNYSSQKQTYRTDKKHNFVSKIDRPQFSQRIPENRRIRRKVQSEITDRAKRSFEPRKSFYGQNAVGEEEKFENFNSNSSVKKHYRGYKRQNDNKGEHDCNAIYSPEFLNRVSDREVYTLTEDDVDFEPEKFHPRYNPNNRAKDSNRKHRKHLKSNFPPKTPIAQKTLAANFKDSNNQISKNEPIDFVKDRRTQLKIFKNALVEASTNESKKDNELHRLSTSSKDSLSESVVTSKDDVSSNIESSAKAVPNNRTCSTSSKVESSSSCKDVTTNQSAKSSDLSVKGKLESSPLNYSKLKEKYEALKADPQDNFIDSCTKPNCSCLDNVLYCSLCDFHIDNAKELVKHKKNVSHQFRKEDFYRVQYLKELPPPTEIQLQKMELLLDGIFRLHAQDVNDVQIRAAMVDKLKVILEESIKECDIHLFGSSVNGFGLKDSNVNIDLAVPQGISPSRVLLNTYGIIKEREDKYINVSKDFAAAVPKITFLDRLTNLTCEITLNNELSGNTSRLFAQYAYSDERVRKLGIVFRYWAKVCEIDQQHVCSLPSYCFPLMIIFFLQQHDPPVIPVLPNKSHWKSENKESIAKLWMEMLKFYGTKFQFKQHVISICQLEPLLCTDKKWTTRMMCIEDPFHNKRNIARSIANQQWFHYIVECIRSTYEYFITCRLPSVEDQSLINNEVFENDGDDEDEDEENDGDDVDNTSSDDICERFEEDQDNDLDVDTVKTIIRQLDLGDGGEDSVRYRSRGCPDVQETSDPQTLHTNESNQVTFSYEFEKSNFITTKKPSLYCRQCQKSGHYKQNCTIDDNLPDLRPLPKLDECHKSLLTEVCEIIFNHQKLSPRVEEENRSLLFNLQKHIQYKFPEAKLELFGSSCNGFGFTDSDLDICLTFGNDSGEDLNQQYIIECLTSELKKYKKIQDILPIPTAKVPIIKFSFKYAHKEGDISIYNTLGQHNTRLLSTYSKIDPRVQKLGYVLKYFAKICDICDASRGSLSSYAYILMVLYFLQQRDPPVIPVLQELYDPSKPMPVRKVDGCNTWFYEDLDNLDKIWPDYNRNKECLGELWIGLLRFYTEKFKVNEFVICIRQKAPLTRFEKLWNTKSIAIEDPFDHSHNLGAGVSRKMNAFIFSAFRRGREHFGRTPPNKRDLPDILEYFFNGKIFTDGKNPPNERGCRICNKIGHKMKDCPLKRHERYRSKQFFGGKRKTGGENQGQKIQEKNIPYNERNVANKSIHKDVYWNHMTNSHFQQNRGIGQNVATGMNLLQNYLPFTKSPIHDMRFRQKDCNK